MSSSNPTSIQATLQTLLKSSTSQKIQACLLQSLENASVAEQETLSVLLAPLTAEAGVSRHCVRCHHAYTENENHSHACKIKHNDEGDSERTEIGYEDMTTTLSCCGAVFDSEDGPDTEYCILAQHTTNSDDVVYYEDGNEGDDGVNEHVVSCESRGCSKKRKAAKKGGRNLKGGSAGKKRKLV